MLRVRAHDLAGEHFEALDLAEQLAGELRPLIERISRHDPDIAGELRHAVVSLPSSLSRSGQDRRQRYRASALDAAGVKVRLQIAVAWAYVDAEAARTALELAGRMVAITSRLTRRS